MRLAIFVCHRRNEVSARSLRQPVTMSYPSSLGSNRGISSGSFCKSASIVAMTSPRATANPASNAALCPAFFSILSTRSHGYRHRPSSSNRAVSSVLPSSTISTSNGFPICRSAPSTRASNVGIFSCSLYAGITSERYGASSMSQSRLGLITENLGTSHLHIARFEQRLALLPDQVHHSHGQRRRCNDVCHIMSILCYPLKSHGDGYRKKNPLPS